MAASSLNFLLACPRGDATAPAADFRQFLDERVVPEEVVPEEVVPEEVVPEEVVKEDDDDE